MSDGQFPAKQAERDEYSVAEESRRMYPASVRKTKVERSIKKPIKHQEEMKKRGSLDYLLATVSREYLKKRSRETGTKTPQWEDDRRKYPIYTRGILSTCVRRMKLNYFRENTQKVIIYLFNS